MKQSPVRPVRHLLLSLTVLLIFAPGWVASSAVIPDLTITNALLYPEPGAPPLAAANISIHDGRISAIYQGTPRHANLTIDAAGKVVTAGLWNSHVHFTHPQFTVASESLLHDMLLMYGFTTVVDTGSELKNTLRLQHEIEKKALPGPRIITASGSFVYTNGTPSYLPGIKLPEIATSGEATRVVQTVLDSGADGIKIFSGSFKSQQETVHLPPRVIKAVSNAAHARQAFVISHPTDRVGLVNAVENGVDVLAHTAPQAGPLGPELIATMLTNHVALIPTLKLWRYEAERAGADREAAIEFQMQGVRQLVEYFNAGGKIFFGTDVGYMNEYDPSEEFDLMRKAGMKFDDILASLTTNPADRFLTENAQLAVGERADIVIYESSPAQDVSAFSRIAYTIKAGKIVYQSK